MVPVKLAISSMLANNKHRIKRFLMGTPPVWSENEANDESARSSAVKDHGSIERSRPDPGVAAWQRRRTNGAAALRQLAGQNQRSFRNTSESQEIARFSMLGRKTGPKRLPMS
jgi:hypothetical protein